MGNDEKLWKLTLKNNYAFLRMIPKETNNELHDCAVTSSIYMLCNTGSATLKNQDMSQQQFIRDSKTTSSTLPPYQILLSGPFSSADNVVLFTLNIFRVVPLSN